MEYLPKNYRALWLCLLLAGLVSPVSMAEEFIGREVLSAVAPIFPSVPSLTGTGGKIQLEVEVNTTGDVTGIKILEASLPGLRRDSEKAARQWKFSASPAATNPRRYVILFVFRMMPDEASPDELTPVFHPPYEIEV
jgi:TonB family protein